MRLKAAVITRNRNHLSTIGLGGIGEMQPMNRRMEL
jgi:hypothetical protein